MIKPVPCAVCGSREMVYVKRSKEPYVRPWFVGCGEGRVMCDNIEVVFARTHIGAILRWNWKQWRATSTRSCNEARGGDRR